MVLGEGKTRKNLLMKHGFKAHNISRATHLSSEASSHPAS
jgi:hypothetical protein